MFDITLEFDICLEFLFVYLLFVFEFLHQSIKNDYFLFAMPDLVSFVSDIFE